MDKKIEKDIDEMKTPSERVLVRVLLIGISALFILTTKYFLSRSDDCRDDNIELIYKNDSLHRVIETKAENERILSDQLRVKTDSENVRLRVSKEYFDNLSKDLKKVLKQKK